MEKIYSKKLNLWMEYSKFTYFQILFKMIYIEGIRNSTMRLVKKTSTKIVNTHIYVQVVCVERERERDEMRK